MGREGREPKELTIGASKLKIEDILNSWTNDLLKNLPAFYFYKTLYSTVVETYLLPIGN